MNWYLSGVNKVSSHTHKTGSWYLLVVTLKNSNEQPHPFYNGVPPRIKLLDFLKGIFILFKVAEHSF